MNINLKKFIEKQMLPQKPLNESEVTNYSQAYKWLSEYLSNNLDAIVATYEKADTIGGSRGMDMTKVLNTVCNKLDEYSKKISESKNFNGKPLNEGENLDEDNLFEDLLTEDELFEDDVNESAEDKKMTEEELKIESLKIATNIAKLMSDVTTDDIITIADKVSGFIRDHQIGSEESSSSEESDIAADLELPSDETSEEKPEESSEENKEETAA